MLNTIHNRAQELTYLFKEQKFFAKITKKIVDFVLIFLKWFSFCLRIFLGKYLEAKLVLYSLQVMKYDFYILQCFSEFFLGPDQV